MNESRCEVEFFGEFSCVDLCDKLMHSHPPSTSVNVGEIVNLKTGKKAKESQISYEFKFNGNDGEGAIYSAIAFIEERRAIIKDYQGIYHKQFSVIVCSDERPSVQFTPQQMKRLSELDFLIDIDIN